jgi:hypothetical protein
MSFIKTSFLRLCGAAAFLVLGCGGGSGNGITSSPADAFTGTWTFGSGSIVPTCTGTTLDDISLVGGNMTITKVDASDVTVMVAASGAMCDVKFTVSGTTATVKSGQTCIISENGLSATLDVTTWTMTVTDGTLMMSMAGTAQVSIISCTPTATGTATKAPSDAATGG